MDVVVDRSVDPVQVLESRSTADPVSGSLVLTSIERGVTVEGAIRFGWQGECRRCLDEVGGLVESQISEIFQVGAGTDSELWDFDGVSVELDPVLTEAILAGLPLAPLCGDDCVGPDPERFPTQVVSDDIDDGGADGTERALDPRWDALAALDLGDDAPA